MCGNFCIYPVLLTMNHPTTFNRSHHGLQLGITLLANACCSLLLIHSTQGTTLGIPTRPRYWIMGRQIES